MKKRIYCKVLIFFALAACGWSQTTTTLTGTITDPAGNPLNGTLVMRLPIPAQYTPTNKAVAASPVTYNLVNGVITGTTPLFDVAALQPSNLYYIARAYDTTGSLQFYGNFAVTGATFNLGLATPTVVTTSNISYLAPPSLIATNIFTGTNTFGLINGVYYPTLCANVPAPSWCSGTDIGGWVNAAAANCPNNGACRIHIPAGPSCLSFTTPIVFGSGKFITLEGDPAQSSCIKYTPTTGTAITFDPGNPDRTPWGIRDLQLIGPGPGTTTTGVSLGPTTSTQAVSISGFRTGTNCCSSDGFGTGIAIVNAFEVTIDRCQITANGTGVSTSGGTEAVRIINSTLGHNTVSPLAMNASGQTDVYSFGNSYDDNSGPITLPTTGGFGNHFTSSGDHFENSSVGAAAQPYISVSNNSHITILGGVMADDRVSGTNTGMINCSGSSLVYIYGMTRGLNGIVVNPYLNASGSCRAWMQFSQSTGTFTDYSSAYTGGSIFDSNFTFNTTGQFVLVNGLQGANSIFPYGANLTTGLTANMGSTQLGGATITAGMYEVCLSMFATATGTATAIQGTISSRVNGNNYTINIGTVLSTAALTNVGSGCTAIPTDSGVTINVATSGYSGTGTYTVRSEVNQIQ